MLENTKSGKFIVLEGMDASGKTTGAAYLAKELNAMGIKTIATREMGGSPIGAELRKIAFAKNDLDVIDPTTRLLLAFASRIQCLRTVIEPALAQGIHVVCDRFSDSTHVYQGMEDRLNFAITDLENIDEFRFAARRPEHLLYFKIDAETAIARGLQRGAVDNSQYKGDLEKAKRIEGHYHKRISDVAERLNQRVRVIDAKQTIEGVRAQLNEFITYFESTL